MTTSAPPVRTRRRPAPAPDQPGEATPTPTPWRRAARFLRRHRVLSVVLVVLLALSPWEASFASALTGTGPGSMSARAAEWVRDHGGASVVAWVENLWYSHHQPPKGGRPPKGAIPAPAAAPSPAETAPTAPAHLTPPAPVPPLASPALPGEGQWHPAGRTVEGLPALYEAFLRPDAVHTSLVAGVAWMDTRLLRIALYSGSYIPGSGPWAQTAPVSGSPARELVAAFNSGFRMKDAMGGYYSEGRTVFPLRPGAASLVIYRDGTATVADWGRDATMTPNVAAVRQNLRLLVDGGAPVPGLATNPTWGATVGNRVYVWRSGLGVTADGALVYVGGPGLDVPSLASLLVRVGAVRGMEMDINADWVNFAAYAPADPTAPANASVGTTLLSGMSGGPGRYFAPWWNRDFIAVLSRADLPATGPPPRGQ